MERTLLPAVLVVSASLRAVGLASWPLEQDELYTLRDAASLGAHGSGPAIGVRPLYYILQHVLLRFLPPTPLLLRLVPFLLGVAGVWLTWRLGRRVFGSSAGLVAALLLAISPWHLYASQFARYWTLVYALSVGTVLLLLNAYDSDRREHWALAMLAILAGALTHPTYAFPLVGVLLALQLVREGGSIGWSWPTRTAWMTGWIPLVMALALVVALIRFTLPTGQLGNFGGRGLGTTLRVIPGIVQWLGPDIAGVAAFGALFMLGNTPDRRWAAMTIAGCSSTLALLVAAGWRNDVYADYGMAMLPLVFVTVGGVVQRLGGATGRREGAWIIGSTAVLFLATLPGTLSHLSDGTRFDYRPGLAWLTRRHGDHPVLSWPIVVHRHYAPDLPAREFSGTAAQLDSLSTSGGFWVVASFARYGMPADDGLAGAWLGLHCRVGHRYERPRFDYRSYRVEVLWCGDLPMPQ